MRNEQELDDALSAPRSATEDALLRCPGDIIVLGAGGKMGPTLARMARRAARDSRRVMAVSRFTSPEPLRALNEAGVETISGDLLDRSFVRDLPDAPNVVFMAGQKFGTTDAPSRTWMMNVVVPALCAERYAGARIVAFSTGNVYALSPVDASGRATASTETTPPAPVGEYAASCLGRERVFEHAALANGTRVALVRLNYANDLRYGVLTDLAVRILAGEPISLEMGFVNVIWQGDANRAALELLPHAASPALVVNVTGPEALSVRMLASELAGRMNRPAILIGTESETALLSDTLRMQALLEPPEVSLSTLLDHVAQWVMEGRPLLGKPTHFETRDGAF